MSYINIHTHRESKDIFIKDISHEENIPEKGYLSVGVHPLFIVEEIENMERVTELAGSGRIIAIGEAGFDRNSETDIRIQERIFEQQVELSETYQLPIIIHCVRAYPELISLKKALKPSVPWIIHGYNNNRQILDQLLEHDFYISAGKALLWDHSNIIELLPEIPLAKLFLETDDSDNDIRDIYKKAAFLLHIDEQQLKEILRNNFSVCFGR